MIGDGTMPLGWVAGRPRGGVGKERGEVPPPCCPPSDGSRTDEGPGGGRDSLTSLTLPSVSSRYHVDRGQRMLEHESSPRFRYGSARRPAASRPEVVHGSRARLSASGGCLTSCRRPVPRRSGAQLLSTRLGLRSAQKNGSSSWSASAVTFLPSVATNGVPEANTSPSGLSTFDGSEKSAFTSILSSAGSSSRSRRAIARP